MSSHYETDRSLLGAELASAWTSTPIAVQNQQFSPPDPTGRQSAPVCWIGFAIEYEQPQEQITFGGTEQKFGVIKHGIFQEQDTGDAAARRIVDDLRDLWAAVNLSGFQVFPKNCWLEPPLSDGTWDAYVLNIPFWRFIEETTPVTAQASATKTVSQASHGLSLLDAIYKNGSTWTKARADASTTLARGIVTRVWDASTFDVSFWGAITITGHGVGAAGTDFYLSQATAGLITTTQPTTGWSQHLGFVDDTNNVVISIGAGVWR